MTNPYVRTPGAIEFVTFGLHHTRFWQFVPPSSKKVAPGTKPKKAQLLPLKCSYSQDVNRAPKGMLSAVFLPTKSGDGQCLTGGSGGCVYVWKHGATTSSEGSTDFEEVFLRGVLCVLKCVCVSV